MLLLESDGCEGPLKPRGAARTRTNPGRHVGPSRATQERSRPAPRLSRPPAPLRSRELVGCPFAPTLGAAGGQPMETGRKSGSQECCASGPRASHAFLSHRPETTAWPVSGHQLLPEHGCRPLDTSGDGRLKSRATASAITSTPSASVLAVANHPNLPRAYSLTGRDFVGPDPSSGLAPPVLQRG